MTIFLKLLVKASRHRVVVMLALICYVVICYLSSFWGFVCAIAVFIVFCVIMFFIVLNKLVKKTNWWKNNMALSKQFVSNNGYRSNLQRNYEVVNVGSNPARFAFFYEDIRGQNWSSGTQGLDMDLEVLRFYHSFMKQGATVILPIVAFSSVSGYLNRYPSSKRYLAKFASILDGLQIKYHPKFKDLCSYMQYPLLYNFSALRYLVKDIDPDRRLDISEQPMQAIEMEEDARCWIEKCWKPEFNIQSLDAPLTKELQEGRDVSVLMMCNMIEFLRERGYKPVIVSLPMSAALCAYFTPRAYETYITSFIRIFEQMGIPCLDYTYDNRFTRHEYYFNALFMNLKGRKAFTHQVLEDIKRIGTLD
ncbi:hypothetical protein KSY15_05090 [Bacteroides cellulosilyticus]|nr:hypothetical protein [Bacteroides cellulosilyticus]MBV3661893.1 hypothetical protein [Bacteroides cellulosilyticus]MBV3684014.1 hypothetical protein [Bacteroides cellulosilyticus]MBV3692211.1 hypothetical protein [Bacteroides cellulosilyticus]MBV3707717.1 hypothetical protein [Bacteroides cellulosilyticus]